MRHADGSFLVLVSVRFLFTVFIFVRFVHVFLVCVSRFRSFQFVLSFSRRSHSFTVLHLGSWITRFTPHTHVPHTGSGWDRISFCAPRIALSGSRLHTSRLPVSFAVCRLLFVCMVLDLSHGSFLVCCLSLFRFLSAFSFAILSDSSLFSF